MTTDTQLAPTDAEIVALMGDPRYSTIGAVREAISRWGAPARAADLPEALRSIQRFEVVDCIDDKHVPAVIPKPHGPWVRYEDLIAERDALKAAHSGEPVARLEIGKTKGGVSLTHIAEPAAFQLQEGMYALYTTPQPTQPQAGAVPQYRLLQSGVDRIEAADEFLSDDTTTWAIDQNGIFSGNIYGGHVLRPARRRIKGGQHGAE